MKTYKAGELREDMSVVPAHAVEKIVERYQWLREAGADVVEGLAWSADSADDFDRKVDEQISASKGGANHD